MRVYWNYFLCKYIVMFPNLRTFVVTKIHLTTSATMNDNESYHRNTKRIGKSGLELIEKSPYHYWLKYLDPNREWDDDDTPAKLLGSASHCQLFEPEMFDRRYIVPPELNLRTNKGKEEFLYIQEEAKQQRKKLLDAKLRERAMRIAEAARKNPIIRELLDQPGVSEHVLEWDDPLTGVGCKMKADRITHSGLIIDLKTTDDASPESFSRSIYKFGYHKQDAWYSDGFQLATSYPCLGFLFVAVESDKPFICKTYTLDERSRQVGRDTNRRNLDRYAECLRTNTWPAYGNEISEISIPSWAFKSY